VRYTEFPEANHNSWDAAYATPELWKWLFAQRRR
jgi:predicted peptidase